MSDFEISSTTSTITPYKDGFSALPPKDDEDSIGFDLDSNNRGSTWIMNGVGIAAKAFGLIAIGMIAGTINGGKFS